MCTKNERKDLMPDIDVLEKLDQYGLSYNKQIEKWKETYSGELKRRDPLGCYLLAIEHHHSILCLVKKKLFGSAFAMLRVLREAVIRGIYLHYCASEKEIENFEKGEKPNMMNIMSSSVEQHLGKPSFFDQDMKFLNDLTHTGFQLVARRVVCNKDGSPSYSNEEVNQLLDFSHEMAMIVFSKLEELSILPTKEN